MKRLFRNILKRILGRLTRWSIAKHSAEIIVITGWTGTGIVRELVYHLLEDEFNVRRNVTEVWWDFSVPLCVLGYADKKRNIYEWAVLISRVLYSLIFKSKYPHKIIINLDSSSKDTAKFWSDYLLPDITVVLKERPKSEIVKMLIKREGSEKVLFVYNPKFFTGFGKKNIREFICSEEKGDLIYKKVRNLLKIKYKNESVNIKIPQNFRFLWEFIPAAFSVGILEGISLKTLSDNLAHFAFHPVQLKKAFLHLREFVKEDEKE